MRTSKCTDAQTVEILHEAEAGMAVAERLRTHGISRPTLDHRKQTLGGAGAPDLQPVKALAQEHVRPVPRARVIALGSRTAFYRAQPVADRPTQADTDAPITTASQAIVAQHGRVGFWQWFEQRRALRPLWDHQHVHRVYCALRLNQWRRRD
jgi:putative transposase